MYTRRASLITLSYLRREIKVCRRDITDIRCSIETPNFVRRYRAATETADVCNNLDGYIGENQLGNMNFSRNDQFYGGNLGRIDQSQNPSRVYGENGSNRIDFPNTFRGGSGVNQSGYSSSFDSRINGWNIDDRLRGQSFGGEMGNGGMLDTTPQNHNLRGGFYNGVGMDYPVVTTDLAEVSQGSQSTNKLETLDQFTREGKLKEAVELLEQLEKERITVELPRYMALVKACGENEALAEAKSIHKHLVNSIAPLEVRTYNQILDMYSKCGSMKDAFTVFDKMPMRNMTSWDTMISGLAKNDHAEESLELFAEFKQSGLKPDGQIFHGVFSACGVLCDVIEGMLHFESMVNDYGIVPSMEDYVSIVDMLGSAGSLDEALEFIQKMPIQPSVEIWETLMKFCRIHGDSVLGDRCAEFIELLDPSRLNEQSRQGLLPLDPSDLVKEKERKRNIQGPPEARHRVREYRAGDRSHPDSDRLYDLLRVLKQQLKEAGYIPEVRCVLHDVDPETKEETLMGHSERLAAAQAFLTSPARSSFRIIKNLRVCTDCHNVFKIMSKIVGREIVARDCKRFHHFRDGSCSCNDYW